MDPGTNNGAATHQRELYTFFPLLGSCSPVPHTQYPMKRSITGDWDLDMYRSKVQTAVWIFNSHFLMNVFTLCLSMAHNDSPSLSIH